MNNYRAATHYTIDEILEHRLSGWEAKEWLFISMLGQLTMLDGLYTLDKSDHYYGLHGCSVVIVASRSTANDGYRVAQQLLDSGVHNLGFWMLEYPNIKELVCCNHRYQTPKNMPLVEEWARLVREVSEGLAA